MDLSFNDEVAFLLVPTASIESRMFTVTTASDIHPINARASSQWRKCFCRNAWILS